MLKLLLIFPRTVLGSMLALSGCELAAASRNETSHVGTLVMLVTAGMGLATSNIAVGFLIGMLAAAVLGLHSRFAEQS